MNLQCKFFYQLIFNFDFIVYISLKNIVVFRLPNLFIVACFTDVDQQTDPENVVGYPEHGLSIVNHEMIPVDNMSHLPPAMEDRENKTSLVNINDANISSLFNYSVKLPSRHPCENFSLPPAPFDPKRTGPRRKFFFFFV